MSIVVAALTGFFGPANLLTIHLAAGLTAGALVLWRVIWGFLGPTYARFCAFAPDRDAIVSRLLELKRVHRRRYLSHNPLGALMVLALLSIILALVLAGAIALGGEFKQGPLAFITPYRIGVSARQIHEYLAIALVILIGLHLFGVAMESVIGKENLVAAMMHGRKSTIGVEQLTPRRAYPSRAIVIFVVGVSGVGLTTAYYASRPGLGVPETKIDPTYDKECGACHFAYPPSLLSAQTWDAMLGALDHHFGEDASLPDATKSYLSTYLAAQSADHFDTRVAHVFAEPNPDEPLRITATRFWRQRHREIPDSLFASKVVGAKGACDACHRDASTGRFDPQAIDLPEKAFQ